MQDTTYPTIYNLPYNLCIYHHHYDKYHTNIYNRKKKEKGKKGTKQNKFPNPIITLHSSTTYPPTRKAVV